MSDSPLLEQRIKEHWRQFRPRMYRQLVQAGRLEQALSDAAQMTLDAVNDLIEAGTPVNVAWELMREEWAFLPSEEELPELGRGR